VPEEDTVVKRILTGLLVLTLLPACSSKRISTDFAEGVDFSQFQTFKYVDKGNSLAQSHPLAHARIVEALRGGMIASGMAEVDEDADLRVTYYGSTSQSVSFNTTHVGYGWGGSSWHHGHRSTIGISSSQTTQTTTTTGNLLIDIWDANAEQLVWRGQVSDTLSGDPERNANSIRRGIEEALWEFPPQ
jgi:hypothetical protein